MMMMLISTGTIVYDFLQDAAANGTDNADFDINNGELFYKGSNAGDFEAIDNTLTVSITRTDSENPENPELYNYVIRLINLNDNAPVLTTTAPADFTYNDSTKILEVPENQASGTLLLTINASDADNVADKTATDTITYTLTGGDGR